MGCYLSTPDNRVYITEGQGKNFIYATASCQGWRREQEDAEIVCPYFDENSSLFILCDGHGGAEVAKYTVSHLPDFIKNHELYKAGKYEEALERALMDFDALLRTDKVMAQLYKVAFDGDEPIDEDKEGKIFSLVETLDQLSDEGQQQNNNNNDNQQAGPSGSGSSSSKAGGSSEATSSRPVTSVEDVAPDVLRYEASVPLKNILEQYSHAADGIDPAKRDSLLSKYNSSPVVKPHPDDVNDDDEEDQEKTKDSHGDQPTPCSSSSIAASSNSNRPEAITKESIKESLMKQVMQHYFSAGGDDSSDDSEYNGDESSNEDGDDEGDGEGAESSSKKQRKRKHKQLGFGPEQSASSDDDDDDAEDETEDETEDDDDEEESDDDCNDEDDSYDEEVDHEKTRNDIDDQKQEDDDDEESWEDVRNVKPIARDHKPGLDSGCTVVVALIKDNRLYVASAGDSRCILIMRDGQCKPMTFDHKPESSIEKRRISKAGGKVLDGRVNGGLNLSRALGDFTYKSSDLDQKAQMITPCPDVRVAELDPEKVEYIFLACDGIWNSMKNQKATRFIRQTAKTVNDNLVDICVNLFRECIAPKTDGDGTGCDNMTCILARFAPDGDINKILPGEMQSSEEVKKEKRDPEKKRDTIETTMRNRKPGVSEKVVSHTSPDESSDDDKDNPKKKRCIRL